MTRPLNLTVTLFLAVLFLGCESPSNDDDGSDNTGPMALTVSVTNSTGFDVTSWSMGVGAEEADLRWTDPGGAISDGSVYSYTETLTDTVYGTQFHVGASGVDSDGWCLSWGPNPYNAGPELTVDIEFTADDYIDCE